MAPRGCESDSMTQGWAQLIQLDSGAAENVTSCCHLAQREVQAKKPAQCGLIGLQVAPRSAFSALLSARRGPHAVGLMMGATSECDFAIPC